ncbi:MAG: hypothetical protein JO001_02880 [Alphaproteobacteria bacterium]|nr:hypothetical protein [Alphaproteobacteria bacterium]
MLLRLTIYSAVLFAGCAGVALAADDPVATAPIPPANHPTVTPQKPLFVAPTVQKPAPERTTAEKPKKPSAPSSAAPSAAAAATPHKPALPKQRVAVVHSKPAPIRHARRERRQYYARVYTAEPSPYYEAPEVEAPPMAPPAGPPAWYNRGGFPPEYPYPGFRRW